MLRPVILCLCLGLTASLSAAELLWDFSQVKPGELPPGFRSTVSGEGKPGRWEVRFEDLPAALAPAGKSANTRKPFLAQTAQDPSDEHFPLLIYEKERFGDFTLTTEFRTLSGSVERMAGIAFRIQDEKNYYVVRASSKGNTFRFYRYVEGSRGEIIGPEIPIPSGTWQKLTVECKGNQIRCLLNDREAIPALTDATFSEGWVGYWTKSDSVSHFANTHIVYTPRETLASVLIRDALRKYPRLVDLKIFGTSLTGGEMVVLAAKNPEDLGRPATQIERDVIAKDAVGYGKGLSSVTVTLPLQDRNGESVAAVQVIMEAFKGQTEQNAIARAVPVVRYMQPRVRSAKDLVQ
jgi:hypothetical protein